MDKFRHLVKSDTANDSSVFIAPLLPLFNEKHWLYIQKRYYLTDREIQVAKLVCRGFNNEDIAAKLKIKHGTVKTHIRNIYRRVRVKNKIRMVLKFVDVAAKLSAKSGAAFAIPIVEIKKTDKKTSVPSDTPQKK